VVLASPQNLSVTLSSLVEYPVKAGESMNRTLDTLVQL